MLQLPGLAPTVVTVAEYLCLLVFGVDMQRVAQYGVRETSTVLQSPEFCGFPLGSGLVLG